MLRLFIGIGLLVLGVGMFVVGMYYGWVSGLPDTGTEAHARYQSLSTAFGVLTYALIAVGALIVVLAIRKMNANYREEQRRAQREANMRGRV